jgi:hypothetical protein
LPTWSGKEGFDLSKYQVIYQGHSAVSGTRSLVDRHFAGFISIDERDLPAALAKLVRH